MYLLLITRWCKELGHQQPWYWPNYPWIFQFWHQKAFCCEGLFTMLYVIHSIEMTSITGEPHLDMAKWGPSWMFYTLCFAAFPSGWSALWNNLCLLWVEVMFALFRTMKLSGFEMGAPVPTQKYLVMSKISFEEHKQNIYVKKNM